MSDEEDEDDDDDDDDESSEVSLEEFKVEKILIVCYGDPNKVKKPGLYFKICLKRWLCVTYAECVSYYDLVMYIVYIHLGDTYSLLAIIYQFGYLYLMFSFYCL